MRQILAAAICLTCLLGPGTGAETVAQERTEARPKRAIVHPFESGASFEPVNVIDTRVLAALEASSIDPANLCSDEVFVRRVFLDVIGTLPSPREIRLFMRSRLPDKRSVLIDSLLERAEFADYWSLKWCDLLRVKAEFPINLWPNAVQAYHRWIHDALRTNRPYDEIVRELLTSSGSNFRVPPVNFYRAVQGKEPAALAAAAALTFMGVRLDGWTEERRTGMEVFFSRVAFKSTAEWKEEIVFLDPAQTEPIDALFPDGSRALIEPGEDPRRVFAEWLITPDNEWFARNIVNRIWSWLMGRGIIHPADDIRPENQASNPGLLACLEKELWKSGCDMKHIFRLILNSSTYQQSPIPRSDHPDGEALFAHYMVRQLEAEVLIDALCWISGTREKYSSPIPEPFTFIPEEHRTITLADGSITSQFLEMFGRPARDTGLESERSNEPTDKQRLHMLNSTHIQKKIEGSWRLRQILRNAKGNRRTIVQSLYYTILSRGPTKVELDAALRYFKEGGVNQRQGANDLAWALINSKEFLYRH
jgi:hypothetical protein